MASSLIDVVRETSGLLADNELGREVFNLWASLPLEESHPPSQGDGVMLSPAADPLIRLWPELLKHPKAGSALLREFGVFLYRRGGDRADAIWQKKLLVPENQQIEEFSKKLSDTELRKRTKTYEQILQSYPDRGHSVDRLVAVHFANALLANNIPFPDSIGVDIRTWGPTSEFARGHRYFSLVPLTAAYCPADVHENFGVAFAELIVNDLDKVQDNSVAYGLKVIIRNIVRRAGA